LGNKLHGNGEAFLSHLKIWDEDYYIEHNEEFNENEINELDKISTTHNML